MDLLNNKKGLYRFIALLAGGVIPFAFAPYDLYFIVFISIALLLYLCKNTNSSRECFFLGYLFGFAMFGIGVNWLHISINLFGGVNLFGAYLFTYMLIAFISLYPALACYLCFRFFKQRYFITFPALWVLMEWGRGWILTGFPWLNLGTSQTDSILISFTPIVGDYGISFIVCLLATLLLQVFISTTKLRIASFGALIIIFTAAYSLEDKRWSYEKANMLDIALIQGAIPQEIKWHPEQRQNTFDIYTQLSEAYWDSDLIIWPETAIPSFYHTADDFIVPINELATNNSTLFMSGLAVEDQKTNHYYNSVLLIDGEHRFYHKHHLVPFGEYLPLKSMLGRILRFLKIPMSDFSSGNPEHKNFQTEKAIIGMSICYEDAYSSEIRRALPEAEILVNVSNDAWFGDSMAPHQHLQIARMRALENGRYLLRSTNTGISAIIDNKGKIVSRSPQFQAHALQSRVKLFSGQTPFSNYGNTPTILFSFFLLFFAFLIQRKKKEIRNP